MCALVALTKKEAVVGEQASGLEKRGERLEKREKAGTEAYKFRRRGKNNVIVGRGKDNRRREKSRALCVHGLWREKK